MFDDAKESWWKPRGFSFLDCLDFGEAGRFQHGFEKWVGIDRVMLMAEEAAIECHHR